MTTQIPNHEQRTLQVNDSGAWRNVFRFQGDNTEIVLRHVHALGEVTTGIKFRIVRGSRWCCITGPKNKAGTHGNHQLSPGGPASFSGARRRFFQTGCKACLKKPPGLNEENSESRFCD